MLVSQQVSIRFSGALGECVLHSWRRYQSPKYLDIGAQGKGIHMRLGVVLFRATSTLSWHLRTSSELQAARGHLGGRRHAACSPPATAASAGPGAHIGQCQHPDPLSPK
jgi:hypothetical protein